MPKVFRFAFAAVLLFVGVANSQPSASVSSLNWAKKKCADLGFKSGTERFGTCVLQLSRDDLVPNPTPSQAAKRSSEATTKSTLPELQAGRVFKDCPDCPELVVVPAGSFTMGSSDYGDEGPPHSVTVTSFAMGRTEVTQGQWKAIMGNNPSHFNQCGDDCPVDSVNWDDIQDFMQKLNTKTGKSYRLPSEAEWEYAARAGGTGNWGFGGGEWEYAAQTGSTGNWSLGTGERQLGQYAWYYENSSRRTNRVATKQSNAFGLFDMYGNVWEWTQDCWNANYIGAPTDGSAWTWTCSQRVQRGGSWSSAAAFTRVTNRSWFHTPVRFDTSGFRVAQSLPTN